MSEKKSGEKVKSSETAMPKSNVISLEAHKCVGEGCKSRPQRAGFCNEHYEWFKEGLITLEGYRARDFDKKYHAWLRRKDEKAA
jgi:hypothetical protein